MTKTLTLFPDQKEIIVELREAMKKNKAILLQSPTGSGNRDGCHMIMKASKNKAISND